MGSQHPVSRPGRETYTQGFGPSSTKRHSESHSQNPVNLLLIKLVRISGFLSFLSNRSVFSTLRQNVLKILRSLGKERKTQEPSLI